MNYIFLNICGKKLVALLHGSLNGTVAQSKNFPFRVNKIELKNITNTRTSDNSGI
jgi:hypothetical protein